MSYSVKDLQQRYNVSQATVLHWCATGQLKFLNVGRDPGKRRVRYRFTEKHLADFEATRTSTPPTPKVRKQRKAADDVPRVYGGW